MQFAQATFLAAAAAVAIPVIVHLMFRSQARKVNLGTLRFLRQVLERNAQRQRIMRWLLLALRMGAVAVLAVLFARPYFLEAALGGDRKLLLVLIDASATMDLKGDQGRLFEQALAETRALIAEQATRTVVEVALFDQQVHPLGMQETADGAPVSLTSGDRDGVLGLLDAARERGPSYRSTNYGAALAWARDLALQTPAVEQELHLYTDLQQSGLDWTELEPLPANVIVHIHDLGRAVVNNVAVTEARPIQTTVRPGDTATIRASVLNSSAFPIAEQVVILKLESAQGKRTLRERVKLEAGSNGAVTFEVPALEAGLWTGTVSVEVEDDLAFDNARQLAVLAAPPHQVLIADGQPHPSALLSESYFLAAALRLSGPDEAYDEAPFDVRVVPLSPEDPLPALEEQRVVLLANPGPMAAVDARRLADYVRAGGGLIVFAGDQTTRESTKDLGEAGLVPGIIHGPRRATDLPYRLQEWNGKHPIWRPLNDPQHGDLRRLGFQAITLLEPADDPATTVLASFRGGEPALVSRTVGTGLVLWWLTPCDRTAGDWPASKLFVPMIHQFVGQPLGLNDGGPIRDRLINMPEDPVEAAAARFATRPLAEPIAALEEQTPGVLPRVGSWHVMNPNPRESETERTTIEEFADRFQLTLAAETSIAPQPRTTNPADVKQHEQWPWAALLVFGLMLMETFVANRTVS
jgi:hypothetical protein